MVRDLKPEDRQAIDDVLLFEQAEADPDTGLKPPPWWHGEEDAAKSAAEFIASMRR